ncbi:MAG: N-acetylmuramic acid 6-phosphate etherase [Phycisphaerales bacterium]|nr:N-acetylmuramic acid 6-phosphate etherase [Phycisphaerales bacterium]
MAVLGGLSYDGVPITIPRITRLPGQATAPVAGSWVFPGGLPSGITIPPVPAQAVATPAPEAATNDSAPIAASPPDRSHIVTELRNPRSMSLHELSLRDVLAVINDEDQAVAAAVHKALPMIEGFVVELAPRFESGGRLIYIGAGSSGRLGVLDASECPPTFQLDPGRVIGIIAGGDGALRKSSEGKEDDPCGSHHDLAALNLAPGDTLLGIAAGGTTPYVHGALRLARDRGCLTSLLTCTTLREPPACDHFLTIETGPEVLTGSTRMKAGTATKLVLNMISTALMVRTGRVYENLMVDLRASNDKLRDRAARIISHLTGLERQPALELLDAAGGLVKVAIVMHRRSLSATAAVQLLDSRRGRLDAVLSH